MYTLEKKQYLSIMYINDYPILSKMNLIHIQAIYPVPSLKWSIPKEIDIAKIKTYISPASPHQQKINTLICPI